MVALLLAWIMILSAGCGTAKTPAETTEGNTVIDPTGMSTDVTTPEDGTLTPTDEPAATPASETVPPADPTEAPEPDETPTPEPALTVTPTEEPAASPTAEPTAVPTQEPTSTQTPVPTATPTPKPTATPTPKPTATPTPKPTATPTPKPTATPTPKPTATPTKKTTPTPTNKPTPTPTPKPTPTSGPQADAEGPLFRFDSDQYLADGFFTPTRNNISSITYDAAKKGTIISMSAANDPWVVLGFDACTQENEEMAVDTDTYRYLQLGVRFDPSAGTSGQFYFQTSKHGGFDEPKNVSFNYKNTSGYQYVTVNMGSNRYWTGTMTDSRLDPLASCKKNCSYELYYIAFFTTQEAADKFGEEWLARGGLPDRTDPVTDPSPTPNSEYNNTAAYAPSYLAGIDDLGRKVINGSAGNTERTDRQVGIFYFLWIGYHYTQLHDNSAIIARNPNAIKSESAWMAAGGGGVNAFHFWGKPLFGYYPSSDQWVMRKHIQMLTDAGVDFLCFDTTNAFTYTANALKLMALLKEYQDQGFDVPKVCFYTNSSSGATMNAIYKEIYQAKPEYASLWYYWDGKPMIVGNPSDSATSEEVKSFFRIKRSVWPNDVRYDDGFPWMEFSRLLTNKAVYGLNGRKEVVNVSVAQHSATCTFSFTAWYGYNDRTRSWHNGKNDKAADAYLYGYNFAEQFEWALDQDPEMIFITGWNEWIAQRQPVENSSRPIRFVDNADPNCSRDIEPMEGGYGDNYYMQMISFIRRYKGTYGKAPVTTKTIDVSGSFAQWNDVASYYRDYEGEVVKRSNSTFEKKTDNTNRNDVTEMKVCEDADNIYFFVKAASAITDPADNDFSSRGWMSLYISTDQDSGWNGFNYVVNFRAPSNGTTSVGRLSASSSYGVSECGTASIRIASDLMMVAVPKASLGISGNASFGFKWADNNSVGDVFSFYKNGEAAPLGRLMYLYG